MPPKGKKGKSKAPAANAPPAAPEAPKAPATKAPAAPVIKFGSQGRPPPMTKQEAYSQLVREALGKDEGSELGSEMDQLSGASDSSDSGSEAEEPAGDRLAEALGILLSLAPPVTHTLRGQWSYQLLQLILTSEDVHNWEFIDRDWIPQFAGAAIEYEKKYALSPKRDQEHHDPDYPTLPGHLHERPSGMQEIADGEKAPPAPHATVGIVERLVFPTGTIFSGLFFYVRGYF